MVEEAAGELSNSSVTYGSGAEGGSGASGGSSYGTAALSSGLDTGGNLGSNLITGMVNNYYQKEAFKRSEALANTAHQREVADLRAAGLNPILSATGGRGSDTPSSGAAIMQPPDGKVASSYWSARSAQMAVNNAQAQNGLINEQARREHSAADLNQALTTKTGFDQLKTIADTNVSTAQAKVAMQDLLLKTYEAAKARVTKGMYDLVPVGDITKGVNTAKSFLEGLKSAPGPGVNTGRLLNTWRDLHSFDRPIQMRDSSTGR